MRRPQQWIMGGCLSGSAVLLLVGVADLVHLFHLNYAWAFFLAAAALPLLAWKTGSLERRAADLANAELAQRDTLQNQLEQQRRAVDELADGLDVAIFICDERAHVLYANLRARDMFGFEDPVGRNILAVTLSYELEQVVLAATRDQTPQRAEIVFTRTDERMGVAKAWPQTELTGRVFLSINEVTGLRRLERIRQDFVANVSHELRTPMTLIRAMAETLLDETGVQSELGERYLGKMIEEIDRLSTLTQDLLTLSTAESTAVQKQACDLAEIVREVVGRLAERARDKGLALSYAGPDHFAVQANPTQMTEVALNLVENAINYTSNGSVKVSLKPDRRRAVLEVRDTGIGIAVEHQKRVFERFYRVSKGRSRQSGGTGLGLSIVKHITEAHGGSVAIESALNHGSTFTASIPIED